MAVRGAAVPRLGVAIITLLQALHKAIAAQLHWPHHLPPHTHTHPAHLQQLCTLHARMYRWQTVTRQGFAASNFEQHGSQCRKTQQYVREGLRKPRCAKPKEFPAGKGLQGRCSKDWQFAKLLLLPKQSIACNGCR